MAKKSSNKTKRKIIKLIGIIAVFLIIIAAIYFYAPNLELTKEAKYSLIGSESKGSVIKTSFVPDNKLISYFEKQAFIKELPGAADIELQVYSFENGQRKIDGAYTIKQGKIVAGSSSDPDIVVVVASKYLKDLKDSDDLCSIIKEANKNKDFGYSLKANNFEIIVRYASLLDYKKCIE